MFTGLVTDIGTLARVQGKGEMQVHIACGGIAHPLGASIAVNGICLTVTEDGIDGFSATLSAETLARTNAGSWKEGDKVNLEPSLKVGDTLGGHLVSGHIDGQAEILSIDPSSDSRCLRFRAPKELMRFIAEKGSVTIDGVSLTVNEVKDDSFTVMCIPHTLSVTTLGLKSKGDKVNLEIDMLARYVERLMQARTA